MTTYNATDGTSSLLAEGYSGLAARTLDYINLWSGQSDTQQRQRVLLALGRNTAGATGIMDLGIITKLNLAVEKSGQQLQALATTGNLYEFDPRSLDEVMLLIDAAVDEKPHNATEAISSSQLLARHFVAEDAQIRFRNLLRGYEISVTSSAPNLEVDDETGRGKLMLQYHRHRPALSLVLNLRLLYEIARTNSLAFEKFETQEIVDAMAAAAAVRLDVLSASPDEQYAEAIMAALLGVEQHRAAEYAIMASELTPMDKSGYRALVALDTVVSASAALRSDNTDYLAGIGLAEFTRQGLSQQTI